MDEYRMGGLKVWAPLFFSVVLVLGMVMGFNLRDTLRNKRDIGNVLERNDRLEEIIDLVKDRYVDTVNGNLLYSDAVSGILKHLDPHTVYIPADRLESINEDLGGGFFGIGVEFAIVRDTIEVTSVIQNGPAEHVGVQIGDQLIKVGDSVVAGTHITSDRIIHMLKGKQYSSVALTLMEAGSDKTRKVSIIRDEIPLYSVDASLMLDSNTGIIKINRFSATTYDEFKKALTNLQAQGMKNLVVDLRENPGGYLEAATMIADEFLDDDKLVVYTKGVHSPRTEYRAGAKGAFESGRLAILVDESSASASEILTGAVQDWDRGIIVGRRTFGKGLVQEQYNLGDGAALRLTVAKYYTPSGRCIQRSFANGKEAYEEDLEKRFEDGALTVKDTTAQADTTRYYTANHRVVYGGGGITPDIYVPYDTSKLSNGLLSMIFSDELRTAVWDYFIHNRKNLVFKSIKDYDERFNSGQQILDVYLASLKPADKKTALSVLRKTANGQYFKEQIKAQLARFLYRDNGYYAIELKDDNVLQKAMHVINSNEYLKIIGRQ